MEAAALHEYPVLQHPTAKASVPQRSGLPAPCVPCPRAGGVLHLPFTHTQPWLQKPSLPERYTSLLPAEKIAAGILQSAHAAARNSHSSTWLQEQRPARLPRCHGSQPSQSGWGPRHPARACGSRHPLCTCAAPGCCCPGALPGGCWPGGCELLRLSLMVHLSKLTPAHVGPASGRPNVRRAPSAAARAVPWRRCAAPRGKLGSWRGRHPPWLASGERRCAGGHGQCLVWGHLSAHPCLGLQVPAQFSWLGSHVLQGAQTPHLHSKVWAGCSALRCGQAFFRHFCSGVQHSAQPSLALTFTSLSPSAAPT